MTLTVVTANLGAAEGNGTPLDTQEASLYWIKREVAPDVVCVQEAHAGLSLNGFRKIAGAMPAGFHEPIFVREALSVRFAGCERIDPNPDEPVSAYVKTLTILDLDAWGMILNGHLNSGIEENGRPAQGVEPPRLAHAFAHIRRYRRWASSMGGDAGCIAAGDWNIDAESDRRVRYPEFPAAQLGSVGLVDSRPLLGASTLENRNVDRILHTGDLHPVGGRVLPKRPAHNHRFAVVRFSRVGE